VTNSTRKMPAINVSRLIETRKLKNPPSPVPRRADVGCRAEFVFIVGVSDEWLNLVSFKNGRQQFSWFRIVGRDLTRLGTPRRLHGELEVVATALCRHVQVERVVKQPPALPPNSLSAPLAIDLPSVRAGLAFSGAVDPPARATTD